MTVEVPDTDLLLLLLVLLLVLGNGLRWGHPHLCRLEGLQSIPHGPLENLLHLFFILVDVEVAATVPVPVLQARGKKQTVFTKLKLKNFYPDKVRRGVGTVCADLFPALVQVLLQQVVGVDILSFPHTLHALLMDFQTDRRHRVSSAGKSLLLSCYSTNCLQD